MDAGLRSAFTGPTQQTCGQHRRHVRLVIVVGCSAVAAIWTAVRSPFVTSRRRQRSPKATARCPVLRAISDVHCAVPLLACLSRRTTLVIADRLSQSSCLRQNPTRMGRLVCISTRQGW